MRRQTRQLIGFVIVVLVAFGSGRWTRAQAPTQPPAPVPAPTQSAAVPRQLPYVVSGNDLGFRVEGFENTIQTDGSVIRRALKPTGTLVIRVNGQWVEPAFKANATRLDH